MNSIHNPKSHTRSDHNEIMPESKFIHMYMDQDGNQGIIQRSRIYIDHNEIITDMRIIYIHGSRWSHIRMETNIYMLLKSEIVTEPGILYILIRMRS